MRAVAHQLVQIAGRDPQVASDPIDGLLVHLPERAPVLEPVGQAIDQQLEPGIGVVLVGHGYLRGGWRNSTIASAGTRCVRSNAQALRPACHGAARPSETGCRERAAAWRGPWARY